MLGKFRFLFLIRRFTVGGSQINLLAIIKELSVRDHNVVLMSDAGVLIDKLPSDVVWHEYPFVQLRHPSIRFYKEVRHIVKEHHIDFIFAIDPAMSIETYVSYLIHKKPVYGFITAQEIPLVYPKNWPVVFVNKDRKLAYEEKFGCSNTSYIKERLDINRFKFKIRKEAESKRIGLITRLDPLKEKSINHVLKFFEYYADGNKNCSFHIIGGGVLLDRYRLEYSERNFIFKGEVLEIEKELAELDVVFAMASTVLQSMASNCVSVVCGDSGIQGVVTMKTVKRFSDYHFNIHNEQGKSFRELSDEIEYYIGNRTELHFYESFIKNNYSVVKGVDKIEDLVCKRYIKGGGYEALVSVIGYKIQTLWKRLIK